MAARELPADRNLFVDRIEVDNDEIRVCGGKSVLERGVIAERLQPTAVPSFVPKWRSDSQPTGK